MLCSVRNQVAVEALRAYEAYIKQTERRAKLSAATKRAKVLWFKSKMIE